MIVLVTGGRHYNKQAKVDAALDHIHQQDPITEIVCGGATGADTCAIRWAKKRGVAYTVYEVTKEDWDRLGPAAGPLRNARMLDEKKPHLVVAFPGGRGTESCCREADRRNIDVLRES